uniref:Uncharacterized protein n=1 Tax=Mustela putorius furo TaxID=9669 RepID=M3Y0E2_MUSPF
GKELERPLAPHWAGASSQEQLPRQASAESGPDPAGTCSAEGGSADPARAPGPSAARLELADSAGGSLPWQLDPSPRPCPGDAGGVLQGGPGSCRACAAVGGGWRVGLRCSAKSFAYRCRVPSPSSCHQVFLLVG